MEFSRQEYCSGMPFPSPQDLPDPGIEPVSLVLLRWQADSLPLAAPGKTEAKAFYFKGQGHRRWYAVS